MGQTLGNSPVVQPMISRRVSLTLSTQPSFTVGVIANPLQFATRFPLVVSTLKIASISGSTSSLFMVAVSTGLPMNGTGSWGCTGASGQICVEMITSPSSSSPFARISASFRARLRATIAPSASETRPICSGRAPTPPRRPMTPRVLAEPPLYLP